MSQRRICLRRRACDLQEALETTAAGRVLAATDIRSGGMVASDSFLSRAGCGDFHRWICRRHRRNLQVCERQQAQPDVAVIRRCPVAEASISGIRSITQQPGSNQVSIKYDTISTQEAQGSLNDQRIQQLLLFAARNNYNSGRAHGFGGFADAEAERSHVREALIYALRYDSNPGVRLKALEGLGAYVKDDVRVRDAVLEALMNDSNPGVRIAGFAFA